MKRMTFWLSLALFAPALYAQTAAPQANSTPAGEANKPDAGASSGQTAEEPTYLDLHMASERNVRLNEQLTRDISRLGVLAQNFGSKVENSSATLEKIRNAHTGGMMLHMRRRYVEARTQLENANKDSQELFKKFAELFQKQNDEILTEATRKAAQLEQNLIGNPDRQGPSSVELSRARYQLQSAFGELTNAENLMRDGNFGGAIDHLRLARFFGINVLADLEDDEAKRGEVIKKYEVELSDSVGRTAREPAAGGTPSAPTN